jgi:hypothetical protein
MCVCSNCSSYRATVARHRPAPADAGHHWSSPGSPEPGRRQAPPSGATVEIAVSLEICLALIVRGGVDAAECRGVRGSGAGRARGVAGSASGRRSPERGWG